MLLLASALRRLCHCAQCLQPAATGIEPQLQPRVVGTTVQQQTTCAPAPTASLKCAAVKMQSCGEFCWTISAEALTGPRLSSRCARDHWSSTDVSLCTSCRVAASWSILILIFDGRTLLLFPACLLPVASPVSKFKPPSSVSSLARGWGVLAWHIVFA